MTTGGKLFAALAALAAAGCSGPEAPDAALCRDVIHRLCIAPRCDSVENGLSPGDDCEGTLQGRTGCGDDAFSFGTPNRARFIDCRATLVRGGVDPDAHPACEDVDAMFTKCPELTGFFKGAP
ncbi:MAG: hypothetical protein IRZ16_22320 [Myxococcaceae bacterium]|nr:hypothetical protein [Myxococcaceae bacterium]